MAHFFLTIFLSMFFVAFFFLQTTSHSLLLSPNPLSRWRASCDDAWATVEAPSHTACDSGVVLPHREQRWCPPPTASDSVGFRWVDPVALAASRRRIQRRRQLPTGGFSGVDGFPQDWDKSCAFFIIFPVPFLFVWIVRLDFHRIYGRKIDIIDENFHGRRKQIESDFPFFLF